MQRMSKINHVYKNFLSALAIVHKTGISSSNGMSRIAIERLSIDWYLRGETVFPHGLRLH